MKTKDLCHSHGSLPIYDCSDSQYIDYLYKLWQHFYEGVVSSLNAYIAPIFRWKTPLHQFARQTFFYSKRMR